MEPQPLRKRRPRSVRFPISSPDMNDDIRHTSLPISNFDGVPSNATSRQLTCGLQDLDLTLSTSDESGPQSRKLQLRQSRFKGLALAPRSITPTSGALALKNNNEFPLQDTTNISPSETSLNSKMRRTSNDLGILQEVSNSSLRRKTSRRQEASTIFQSCTNGSVVEDQSRSYIHPDAAETNATVHSSVGPTVMANSSLPLRSDLLKTPHARVRVPRLATAHGPAGTESEKYIEHLESQLAALQTRVQALNSPSTSKPQSAKLRAVTSESRFLRQEVMEWERKFHERITEQVEQHEMVVGSLRAQVKSLQKELETSKERMTELALECAGKDRLLMAAEGANYDLERRLEFMSEMLATSPSKTHFNTGVPLDNRRISAPRPQLRGHFQNSTTHKRQSSIQHNGLTFPGREVTHTPESPTRKSLAYAWEVNPFDRSIVEAATATITAELDFGMSDATFVESAPLSPSNGRSFAKFPHSDNNAKVRPTRRMRRFYTGSMGPRSLILPSATQAPPLTSSPSMSVPGPPLLTSHIEAISDQHHLGFKLPISPERPYIHIRSATWDDNEASASRNRQSMLGHMPLPLPSPSRNSICCRSPLSSAPSLLDANVLTPLPSQKSSAQSSLVVGRDASFGSVQGRNLFEELSRIKHLTSSGKKDAELAPSELMKHRLSPSPEYSPDCDNGQIAGGATSLALELAGCPPLDLSFEPDDNCAIEVVALPCTTLASKEYPPVACAESQPVTLTSPPTSLIERLLSFVSRSLDVSTPSVSAVISNAWSIVTLSRPVLEFRWWLVRLLIGGLRKKRKMKVLGARTPAHGLGISVSPGLMISNVSSTDNGDGGDLQSRAPVMRNMRDAQGFHDDLDSLVGDNSVDQLGHGVIHSPPLVAHAESQTAPPVQVRPVAWLKFSMTLVFAVGLAIKDGPASLFRTNVPVRRCANELDDGYG